MVAWAVVLLCVVSVEMLFLIKQKTSYEMRISDWSSDVCSSDLPQPPAPQPRERRVLQHELHLEQRHTARIARRIQGADQSFEGHKIGRASCRERVCQYV